MESLYIFESGSYLRKDGDCLKIMKDRTVQETIPAAGLYRLTLNRRKYPFALVDSPPGRPLRQMAIPILCCILVISKEK